MKNIIKFNSSKLKKKRMEHIEVYNYCTNYERYRTLSNKNKNSFDYEVLDS